LSLPAGAEMAETVSVDVPKMASSGERYAVVWAEISAAAPAGAVALVILIVRELRRGRGRLAHAV
jgi:hypothetical protein